MKATFNDELNIDDSIIEKVNYMMFTASIRSGTESSVNDHGESSQDDQMTRMESCYIPISYSTLISLG